MMEIMANTKYSVHVRLACMRRDNAARLYKCKNEAYKISRFLSRRHDAFRACTSGSKSVRQWQRVNVSRYHHRGPRHRLVLLQSRHYQPAVRTSEQTCDRLQEERNKAVTFRDSPTNGMYDSTRDSIETVWSCDSVFGATGSGRCCFQIQRQIGER